MPVESNETIKCPVVTDTTFESQTQVKHEVHQFSHHGIRECLKYMLTLALLSE